MIKQLRSLIPFHYQSRHSTIRTRLVLLISVLIAGISIFIYLYFPAALQRQELKNYTKSAVSIAEMTAYSVAPALFFNDTSSVVEVINSVRQNPDLSFIVVLNDSDRIVATVNENIRFSMNNANSVEHSGNYITPDGRILITRRPITINAQVIGTIVLGLSLDDLRKAVNDSKKTTALVSLVILGTGIILVTGISALLTRPLGHMVNTIERIAAGDYSHRANPSSSLEVNRLAGAFNQMAERIQIAQNQLEQMNRDLEKRVQERTRELRKEIIQRKRDEKKIVASLREKEVLLKEIHHRVKNNLQIIQSLLYLQSQGVLDSKAQNFFTESVNRIRSIALLHEKLYKSGDLARIDFSDYVRDLVQGIYQAFDFHSNLIKFDLHVTRFYLGIDMAIPCGLIINELVSNALKYAFTTNTGGDNKIAVIAKKLDDKSLFISIQDNGCGMPENIDIETSSSLGLRLVNSLVKDQLNGKIQMLVDAGTRFDITVQV